uniref:Uncharacterized protein n=1 Tax=Fibrocapsa japonica TaxID=94617 RepID=A0A7S2XYZ6_9STRA|mmetsp:Transcript_23271/g.33827  ORF Transcript_23271/g.33827 Transcript_23271/m.33827 type:complete len:391 (+) Transcript_23271:87-1259(+)
MNGYSSHADPINLESSPHQVRATVRKSVPAGVALYECREISPERKSARQADRCAALAYDVHKLQTALTQAQAELARCRTEIPQHGRMVSDLRGVVDAQHREIVKYKALLDGVELEKGDLERQKCELSKDRDRLIKVVRRYQSPTSGPQSVIDSLRREVQHLEQTIAQQDQRGHREKATLEQEVDDLKRDLVRERNDNRRCRDALTAANNRCAVLEGEKEDLSRAVHNARQNAEDARRRAEDSMNTSEATVREFEDRLQQALTQGSSQQEDLDDVRAECERLYQQNRDKQAQIDELNMRLRHFKDLSDSQSHSLQRAREALLDAQQKRKNIENVQRLEHMNMRSRARESSPERRCVYCGQVCRGCSPSRRANDRLRSSTEGRIQAPPPYSR